MRPLIFLMRKLTGNGHQIPLLYVTLDIDKYHESVEDFAECRFHPDFKDDEELKQMAFQMTDYIRAHYDMDKLLEPVNNPRK